MRNKRLILPLTLVALILVFFIQNAEELQVRFLFWSVTMRRVYILFGVLAIGIILGWLLRTYMDSRQKEEIKQLDTK